MSETTVDSLTSSRPRLGDATRFVLAAALLPGLLAPLTGCGAGPSTPSEAAPAAGAPAQTADRPPIDLSVLRGLAEGHEDWSRPRKARCPRQLPDRHEELRPYPAISILDGLGYIKIVDGTASGMYVKNMELTDAGRMALGSNLEERPDWYIITVARKEYLPGTEKVEIQPNGNRLTAYFRWRWKPLNGLGERLNLGPTQSQNDYFNGFATYTRAGDEWMLDKVYLNGVEGDF